MSVIAPKIELQTAINQIFISYAHENVEDVILLRSFFQNQNIRSWYDYELRQKPGIEWKEEIKRNLDLSSVFIILLSPFAIESEFVQKEYRWAINSTGVKKIIIPIILDSQILDPTNDYNRLLLLSFPNIFTHQYIPDETGEKRGYLTKYTGSSFRLDYQQSLFQLVEQYIGVDLQMTIGLVPFYDAHHALLGMTSRHYLHYIPQGYHRTVIVILVDSASKELIIQIKPKKRTQSSGSLAFFGGHSEINESYLDTAIREISEEINIPFTEVLEHRLIQVGQIGEMKWQGETILPRFIRNSQIHSSHFQSRYNYEFSTLYVLHLKSTRNYFFQETLGYRIVPVQTLKMKFTDLYKLYHCGLNRMGSTKLHDFFSKYPFIPEEVKNNMGHPSENVVRFSDDIIRIFGESKMNHHQNQTWCPYSNLHEMRLRYLTRIGKALFEAIYEPNKTQYSFCRRIS